MDFVLIGLAIIVLVWIWSAAKVAGESDRKIRKMFEERERGG